MAFKPIPIIVSLGAVAGVTFIVNKFVLKSEFSAQQAIINAIVVGIILGLAGMVTKKTVGGQGIEQIPQKIANK